MNQDSRLFRRLGVLAATAVVALCFCRLAASAEEARKGKKEMTVIEKLAVQEKMLKKKLADDTLWTDAKRKDELLKHLKEVTYLRRLCCTIQSVNGEGKLSRGLFGEMI